jgi:hypothetical protein
MASLQCPSCGTRHPIDIVPDSPTFACQQCRRLLKVPDALRHRRGDAIVTPHAGPNGDGGGGRVPTLSPTPGTGSPAARAGAPAGAPVAASSSAGALDPGVAAPATRPPGTRSAMAAAVEARSDAPAGGAPPPPPPLAPVEAPQEILAPPLSPQASAALGAPGRARLDGAAAAPPVVPAISVPADQHVVVVPTADEEAVERPPTGVHWTLRLLIWIAALAIAAVAVVVPYRRVGLIDFDGALKVIGGRGFEQWELPLIIVPPWAMGTALIAHFSIEGLGRLKRRSWERKRERAARAAAEPA